MNATLHHVNVTVPRSLEDAAKHFYGVVMGLQEVPKPETSRGRGGAWYQLGPVQLHLSIEEALGENCVSKRHVCYTVSDLAEAEERFRVRASRSSRTTFPHRAGRVFTFAIQAEIDWRSHKQFEFRILILNVG